MRDSLGDFLKSLEKKNTDIMASDENWIYIRLDGRAFHTLTRNMNRPYDSSFMHNMQMITQEILKEFGATIIMQQSDEISIAFAPVEPPTQRIYQGKYHKLLSVIPSFASSRLARRLDKDVEFDARIIETDDFNDIVKLYWWRFKDCRKNAISMVANHFLSAKQLNGVNTGQRLEYIKNKQIWIDTPNSFKYGFWASKNGVVDSKDFVYYSEFAPWFEEMIKNELTLQNQSDTIIA